MDRAVLLGVLPPYLNRYTLVKRHQDVFDIVKEVLAAHEAFAPDYDLIAPYFEGFSKMETCKRLFQFLKKNIPYEVEPEKSQTTKSPSALLHQSFGDCKHYAGFIAGVLDALNRRGADFDFAYRFASYSIWDNTPGHVFVVVWINGNEVWVDPVLKSFNQRLEPTYILDKRVKNSYMLSRVSGVYDGYEAYADLAPLYEENVVHEDNQLSPEVLDAINLLLAYRVLNEEGHVNDDLLADLVNSVPSEVHQQLVNARVLLHQQVISGIFGDLWHGVKAATLAVPRNAYLGLVAINAFGFASKLAKAIYKPDGLTIDWIGYKKIADKWTALGGKRENLRNAVDAGKKKKAILAGVGVGDSVGAVLPAVPAWVATASAVILALKPILDSILNAKQGIDYSQSGIVDYGITASDYNNYSSGGGVMDFIKENPLIVAAAGVGLIYLMSEKKKSV
jgi:hypothetical protein